MHIEVKDELKYLKDVLNLKDENIDERIVIKHWGRKMNELLLKEQLAE